MSSNHSLLLRYFKKFFYLFLTVLIAHLFQLFFLHFTYTFHAKDFEHGFHKNYELKVEGLDFASLDSLFSQPFHYLGQGKQMTAFESEDGRYVLKLFNPMRPLKKGWYKHWKYWQRYSSLNWINREWFHKKARLKKLFHRHRLAYETLKDESGLVFVHLSQSKKVNHLLTLIDAQGKKHILSLENTPFVVQKKATLVPAYLNQLIAANRYGEAKEAASKISKLFEKRLQAGITDRIQTLENNYGFVDGEPIQIDLGRIRFDPKLKENSPNEQERILSNFNEWLTHNYPVLYND